MAGHLKLTARGKGAVTIMAEIAQQGRNRPVSLADVAANIGLSMSYLETLCVDLRRGRLITSFRGSRGGYKLTKPAAEISILDIALLAQDWPGAGNNDDGSSGNPQVQDLWDEIEKYQYLFLQQISLADVINGDLKGYSFLKRIREKLGD